LKSGDELKNYLILRYAAAAQYDDPPRYPVEIVCRGIDGANASGKGILKKIFAGVVALDRNSTCYIVPPNGTTPTQSELGYSWQVYFSTFCFALLSEVKDCSILNMIHLF